VESVAARAELTAGMTDAARTRLVSAKELDPENAQISLLLADCYGQEGLLEDQARELERARGIDPKIRR
jgi:tetratricopeptide (TPR) repeat protein